MASKKKITRACPPLMALFSLSLSLVLSLLRSLALSLSRSLSPSLSRSLAPLFSRSLALSLSRSLALSLSRSLSSSLSAPPSLPLSAYLSTPLPLFLARLRREMFERRRRSREINTLNSANQRVSKTDVEGRAGDQELVAVWWSSSRYGPRPTHSAHADAVEGSMGAKSLQLKLRQEPQLLPWLNESPAAAANVRPKKGSTVTVRRRSRPVLLEIVDTVLWTCRHILRIAGIWFKCDARRTAAHPRRRRLSSRTDGICKVSHRCRSCAMTAGSPCTSDMGGAAHTATLCSSARSLHACCQRHWWSSSRTATRTPLHAALFRQQPWS